MDSAIDKAALVVLENLLLIELGIRRPQDDAAEQASVVPAAFKDIAEGIQEAEVAPVSTIALVASRYC